MHGREIVQGVHYCLSHIIPVALKAAITLGVLILDTSINFWSILLDYTLAGSLMISRDYVELS